MRRILLEKRSRKVKMYKQPENFKTRLNNKLTLLNTLFENKTSLHKPLDITALLKFK